MRALRVRESLLFEALVQHAGEHALRIVSGAADGQCQRRGEPNCSGCASACVPDVSPPTHDGPTSIVGLLFCREAAYDISNARKKLMSHDCTNQH